MFEALLDDEVVDAVRRAFTGVPLFVVGGPVRDALAGRTSKDLDFTTLARPDQARARLARIPNASVYDVGARFGTVAAAVRRSDGGTDVVEVTTFRRETYNPDSRKPVVVFGDDIVADLMRRDLTINAMAVNVHTRELVDPFSGREDLAAGRLRTPADARTTFDEDPLRILRAVRFAVRFGFEPDPALVDAAAEMAPRLAIVSVERKRDELLKIAAGEGRAVAAAVAFAARLGVTGHLFGDLCVDDRLVSTVSGLTGVPLVLAAFALHTGASARSALAAIRLSTAEVDPAGPPAELAATLGRTGPERCAVRRLVRTHDDSALTAAFTLAAAAGLPVHGDLAALVADVVATEPQVRGPLPVTGHDAVAAGLKGPAIGSALARVTELFLSDPSLGRAELLAALAA